MLGLGTLRRVAGEVRRDLEAARDRDPAATGVSPAEILAAWPGVHALLSHRVAHALRGAGVPVAPRALAYVSRSLTGIEIHRSEEHTSELQSRQYLVCRLLLAKKKDVAQS